MTKKKDAMKPAIHEEQPQRGGSYLRDPDTGALTLNEATDTGAPDGENVPEFSGYAEDAASDETATGQEV